MCDNQSLGHDLFLQIPLKIQITDEKNPLANLR